MLIHVTDKQNNLLAIIVKNPPDKEGTQFFTSPELSQQLGMINYPTGHTIKPHLHNIVERHVRLTQEVLFIQAGKIRANFFDNQREYIESHILVKDDVIILVQGGHGFDVLEQVKMFEVKQGPYAGENDKTQFKPDYKENE